MHHRNLTEPFFVLLKTAIFAGIVLAVPVILYQIWKFVAPGLYPDERKVAIPFVIAGSFFFIAGIAFCYEIILPYAYRFLLTFGQEVTTPELMMEEFFGLTTKLLLAFGVVFEMPVFATFFARIGLITHKTLLRYWRHAIVACFVAGAMLTPPDIISQVFLAGPMIILYFVSVLSAWIFGKERVKPDQSIVNT
jgi:sec-independent protein translocase protein TatC